MDSIPGASTIDYAGLNFNFSKDENGDVQLERDALQAKALTDDDVEIGSVNAGTYSGLSDAEKQELDTLVDNATSVEDLGSRLFDKFETWRTG